MKYYFIEDSGNKTEFESLGELYLSLEEDNFRFCHVESEDGKERFPSEGDETEARVKGLIAMKLLNLDQDYVMRKIRRAEMES
ncbi:hypothetical protein JW933_11935 [candidate division FCPU426 bacterium]|nr:hypothetical protein [candidate division FCPU426 bacterium]